MRFELPELPYSMNALEPYISEKALECHYMKYQQAYLANLNKLILSTRLQKLDLETIIKVADGPVFNYAALVWNHSFYFEGLGPQFENLLNTSFAEVIESNFGSVTFLKSAFIKEAQSFFGVGWIWLVLTESGTMKIIPKCNAGNPMRIGYTPLLTCDLWEHAYYLDYQNRYEEYINGFWNLVNWSVIEKRYLDAISRRANIYDEQKT